MSRLLEDFTTETEGGAGSGGGEHIEYQMVRRCPLFGVYQGSEL